jgi:hypothetical protein
MQALLNFDLRPEITVSDADHKQLPVLAMAGVGHSADADISEGKISVLTPVGTALIGLRKGQSIAWSARDGKRHALTVLDVTGPEEPEDDDPGPIAA